jgi:hypothetical protein
MIFMHLYDADDTWIGQFPSVEGIQAYLNKLGADINDYRIEYGVSKYPSA